MKVDPALQRRLLDLAEIDAELSRVAHRRGNLPEHAELTEAEKAVQAQRDAHVAAKTALGDLDREVERQEREVESVRARAERDRKLMESGSVSAKQLSDVEHELETLQRRQNALEEDLLELMERREATEEDERRAAAEVTAKEEAVAEITARRDEALAELDSTRARRESERSALLVELPEDLIARYDRVRQSRGVGAGLLRYRRCGACQLELDRVALSEIKAAAADDVVTCDNCGAILVRTAESGL
ncbi:C4-type zinc ribbon domain-containing protein [Haloechinothrix sp. LS1_15]|uniref:zinc ribbon domain-containing protein n=1 Tax=Haloechinothrix sp. LS1_15 TaxID=2652248 RepID=UPI0029442326|nr:C4-type zinc ribbon domain-containing protein [Haloechinothrix sp. LS1_15]MDV6013825.1 hypothetical protein [Haloechinothrix sp. LS1_15]